MYPKVVVMSFYMRNLPSRRSMSPFGLKDTLLLFGIETFARVCDHPSLTLNMQFRWLRAFVTTLNYVST